MGGLCRSVGAEIWEAPSGAGAGNDHELSTESVSRLLAFHGCDSLAAAFDRAEQVGIKYLPNVFFTHGVERTGETITRVADNRIEAAEFFESGGDDAVAIFRA